MTTHVIMGPERRTTWCKWNAFNEALLTYSACLCAIFTIGSASITFSDFRFSIEPRDTVVASGKAAILDCTVQHADSTPEIKWHKGHSLMTLEDTRRHTLSNGSLYFEEIEHSRPHKPDEDVYQCFATVRDVGSIISTKASLTVAYLDRYFDEEPQDVMVHLSDVAMFSCKIQGAPTPTIRWFRDEQELNQYDLDYHFHIDGVLEIRSVQFAHLGRYKCRAENIDKSRTSEAALLSQDSDTSTYSGVSPRFVMTPWDTIAKEGTTAMLYCGANGHDRLEAPPTITWLKNGITLDMADLDSRFTTVGQGSLQIDALSPADSGTYTCRATNAEDSVDAVATLFVQVAPRFLSRPKNTLANINDDVELQCEVDGIPKPRIIWLHNGDAIIPDSYFQLIDGHNLKILGLVMQDAGMYQCFVENDVGNIQSVAQIIVVQPDDDSASALELPSTPNDLQAAFVSTRFITLSWQPPNQTGLSEVTHYVVYFKEAGSNRERTQNTTQLEANIQHLKPGASYTFRVVAYNQAGRSPEAAQITKRTQQELSVPGPPRNLRATPMTTHSIRLEWDPPVDSVSLSVDVYKIYYYEVGAQEKLDINSEQTSYTLTDLKGYREYSFRVLAYNNNGAGVSTDEVIARTYSGKPSEPPQNVTVEPTSSTSLEIHWEPPPADSCNGILLGYKLKYKERDMGRQEKANSITTDSNLKDYVLTRLKTKTAYQVRVLAMTQNGTGPPSEWIVVDTLETDLDESTVPGQPQAIHVRSMTDSILISWTPPAEQDIMIRGYVLGYGINVPDVFQQVLKAKQRYYTIKNLEPDSNYIIRLRAFNSLGEGQSILASATTRSAAIPEPQTPMDPPVGLRAVVLSANTILLTWTDISLGDNQRVNDNRFYTVAFNPKTSHKKKYVNSTDLNAHIEDLRPNTEYEFAVMVIKGRRRSSLSMSIFVKTHEAAPASAPRDLTPSRYPDKDHPSWVTLSWQPPRTPNGQLTGYMVYYTTESTLEDQHWVLEKHPGDQLTTVIRDLSLETTYYFKVQAKNSKGFGPPSPTVLFRTPSANGEGGGVLKLPDDWGSQPNRPGVGYKPSGNTRPDYSYPSDRNLQGSQESKGGLPPKIMWIIIGCISGITILVVIVVSVIFCRRKMTDADRKKKRGPGYKQANKGPKDLKPPDLWIDQMELKNMDKSNPETTASVSPLPRDGQHKDDDGTGERNYDPHEERYQRAPLRPKSNKPIMISVDQPPPPREPIATAVPNGHLSGSESGQTPIRPVYPRTQYTSQYTSTPRVNAGDVVPPPAVQPQPRQQQPQQQATSPYKKGSTPTTAQAPGIVRSALPVVSPRAPDVTRCGNKEEGDLVGGTKSISAEDLTAQMANLEGLMKDLNAITQQEFEC